MSLDVERQYLIKPLSAHETTFMKSRPLFSETLDDVKSQLLTDFLAPSSTPQTGLSSWSKFNKSSNEKPLSQKVLVIGYLLDHLKNRQSPTEALASPDRGPSSLQISSPQQIRIQGIIETPDRSIY